MVDIRITTPNGTLEQSIWRFVFNERRPALILSDYCKQVRKTTRHGWTNVELWARTDQRNNTIAEAPLPDSVAAAAKEEFCNSVTVSRTWDR